MLLLWCPLQSSKKNIFVPNRVVACCGVFDPLSPNYPIIIFVCKTSASKWAWVVNDTNYPKQTSHRLRVLAKHKRDWFNNHKVYEEIVILLNACTLSHRRRRLNNHLNLSELTKSKRQGAHLKESTRAKDKSHKTFNKRRIKRKT